MHAARWQSRAACPKDAKEAIRCSLPPPPKPIHPWACHGIEYWLASTGQQGRKNSVHHLSSRDGDDVSPPLVRAGTARRILVNDTPSTPSCRLLQSTSRAGDDPRSLGLQHMGRQEKARAAQNPSLLAEPAATLSMPRVRCERPCTWAAGIHEAGLL